MHSTKSVETSAYYTCLLLHISHDRKSMQHLISYRIYRVPVKVIRIRIRIEISIFSWKFSLFQRKMMVRSDCWQTQTTPANGCSRFFSKSYKLLLFGCSQCPQLQQQFAGTPMDTLIRSSCFIRFALRELNQIFG